MNLLPWKAEENSELGYLKHQFLQMFGKVSTLMIALKIMLLCLTTNFWNYGSQYKKCEDDTTGVPCQEKEMTQQLARSRREYIATVWSL